MMEVGFAVEEFGDRTVLEVSGEIDSFSAPRLREQLAELSNDGKKEIVVDLHKVDFLDSTGLGVLVSGLKRFQSEGGNLTLVADKPRIIKLLEITGLDEVFSVYSTSQEAVSA